MKNNQIKAYLQEKEAYQLTVLENGNKETLYFNRLYKMIDFIDAVYYGDTKPNSKTFILSRDLLSSKFITTSYLAVQRFLEENKQFSCRGKFILQVFDGDEVFNKY